MSEIRAKLSSAPFILTAIGVAMLILAGFLWWNFIYQSPRNVFWAAMENNLSTSSVIRHTKADNNGQGIDQLVRMQLGSTNAVQWIVTLKQTNSTVTTESIGTPTAGYVRYIKASTNQKHSDGSNFDFSKVLGVWAKDDGSSGQSLPKLFSETLLDVGTVPTPPIGNLTPEQRENIITFMRDQYVYKPKFDTMTRKKIDGREVYTYDVEVNVLAYLRMMQSFARNIGLKDLESVDASSLQTVEPITFQISVDSAGRYMKSVGYKQQGYQQTYSGFGITEPIVVPTHTITVSELQARLRKL